jgi:hypothetical protein
MTTDPGHLPAHWDRAFEAKTPDQHSWYQGSPRVSLQLIRRAAPRLDEPVIDVGGGASMLVDALLNQGFQDLTVLDISSAALQISQRRLGERAERIEWNCTDVRDFHPSRRFRLWHDRALFHFLVRQADRKQYRRALLEGLDVGGQLILATFAIDGPTRCSGLDIVQYDADKISVEFGRHFQLLEQVDERHFTPAGGEQRFSWFRLQRR